MAASLPSAARRPPSTTSATTRRALLATASSIAADPPSHRRHDAALDHEPLPSVDRASVPSHPDAASASDHAPKPAANRAPPLKERNPHAPSTWQQQPSTALEYSNRHRDPRANLPSVNGDAVDAQQTRRRPSKHAGPAPIPPDPLRDERPPSQQYHHQSHQSTAGSYRPKTHRRSSASRPATSPASTSSFHSPLAFPSDDHRDSYFGPLPHHPPSPSDHNTSPDLPGGFTVTSALPVRPSTSGDASPAARSPYSPSDASTPLRSPPLRRPPASRSAHGIETAFGPPPALSTQRSYSTDRWRRAVAAADSERGLGLLVPVSKAHLSGPSPISPAENSPTQAWGQLDGAFQNTAQSTAEHVPTDEHTVEDGASESLHESHEPISQSIEGDDTLDPTPAPAEDAHSSAMDASPQRRSLLGAMRPRSNSKRLSAHSPPEPPNKDEQMHEDLFLDLAKGEDYQTPSNDGPKPSRIALPSHRPSASHAGFGNENSAVKSSPLAHIRRRSLQRATIDPPPQSPTTTVRNPSVKQRPYAASAHPLDSPRASSRLMDRAPPPLLSNSTQAKGERSPELPGRRQSVTENFSRPYRSSYLQHMTNGDSYSSPIPTRGQHGDVERSPPPVPRHEGTESTVSTTAPSTVWDELDDLKSRIRKLEITGKLPSSGLGISGSSERPQTATTTVTTVSSSPKRTRQHSLSPADAGGEGEEPLHPLLRSALAKNQGHLTTAAYRALETCTQDVLAMAQLSASAQHQAVAQSTLERTLKRSADNLCRSMTELCISLAESRGPFSPGERRGSTSRPGSRSGTTTLRRPDLTVDTDTRFARAQSLDPEPTSARVLSRLEARRSSLAGSGAGSGSGWLSSSRDTSQHSRRSSPSREREREREKERDPADPATATTPTQSTLGRHATLTQRRHLDAFDGDRTLRPLSRARTDAGARAAAALTVSGPAAKRISREYTSQHPLPSSPAAEGRSPLAGSRERTEPRRSYLSSTVSSTLRRTDRERERPASNVRPGSENRAAAEGDGDGDDNTLTIDMNAYMPPTPSTAIGPDDHRRRSLADPHDREHDREHDRARDRDRDRERAYDRPRLVERDSERSARTAIYAGTGSSFDAASGANSNTNTTTAPNANGNAHGDYFRAGHNSWQNSNGTGASNSTSANKYATVREVRDVRRSTTSSTATAAAASTIDGRAPEDRPSGIAAPPASNNAVSSSSGSAALERAQKRLSGSYGTARLAGVSGRFNQGIRSVPRE